MDEKPQPLQPYQPVRCSATWRSHISRMLHVCALSEGHEGIHVCACEDRV